MSYLLVNIDSYLNFIKYQSSTANTKDKGDAFEALVYCYLTLHPSYITKLKNVWHWKNVPSSVLTSLGVPLQDLGIDILAETFEGSYWAIQCKYVSDEEHSIGHDYISTFTSLAFGICKNIEFALLCTTADRFSSKLAMYEGKLGILAGDIWRGLDEDFFAQIKSSIEHKKINLQPKLPRPHQSRAIEKAAEYFADPENTKGKLIMPCGTGKSLTGFWIAEVLSANTVLVALPSLSLIRQTLEVWTREAVANTKNIEWLVVCSDDSVSDMDNDDIAVMTQDLGIAVDTDVDKIARWLSGRHQSRVVLFSTYQSGKITAEASRKSGFAFELGIFDEAHKTVGKDGGLFSHLIYDKNIKINRKIFMTATERHYKGNSEKIASMDNPLIYGDDFEVLSFKEALLANPPILCDYKIITMLINSSEIASLIEQNIALNDDDGKAVESEMIAAMIALNKAMDKYPIRHAVSFHSSIKKAKKFKELVGSYALRSNNNTEVFHVSGKTPTASRLKMINRFAISPKALITNARCLTEGVDVPGIDAVLFANPRKSVVDIVQAVGRALRIYDGKQYGYVIVPVVIDSDNLEESEAGAYDAVIAVLKALAANDERIVDYFREINSGIVSSNDSMLLIDAELGSSDINIKEFSKAVELKIWSHTKKLAWRQFDAAREFVRSLQIKSLREWREYCKSGNKPSDIPNNADNVYAQKGWIDWNDWLGSEIVRLNKKIDDFVSFEEAREFARTLGLQKSSEWVKYCNGYFPNLPIKPDNIPSQPEQKYLRRGWINYKNFLIGSKNRWRTFEEAREFIKSLGLKSREEWEAYRRGDMTEKGKLPSDIPKNPDLRYGKSGWISVNHWIGLTDDARKQGEYRSFEEAREFVRSLGLNGQVEWRQYCKSEIPHLPQKPSDIPWSPDVVYKDEWQGFGDWVGTGRIRSFGDKNQWRPFEEAREFVQNLGLKDSDEWLAYLRGEFADKEPLPNDIPNSPQFVYKNDGWVNSADWLGNGQAKTRGKPRDYETAKNFVHTLGIKNSSEWAKYAKGEMAHLPKRPEHVPASPQITYKDKGWVSWDDWLGSETTRSQKMMSYEGAKKFVHTLKLKNSIEWRMYRENKFGHLPIKPDTIPVHPDRVYRLEWLGWADWLGSEKR